jgi:hypothetical protein
MPRQFIGGALRRQDGLSLALIPVAGYKNREDDVK